MTKKTFEIVAEDTCPDEYGHCERWTTHKWGYDAEHAEERFYDSLYQVDTENVRIVSIKQVKDRT